MTIWLVTWHNPSGDSGIEAIFSSREKAKEFIKRQKVDETYSWFKIKEITVNQEDKVYVG